MLSLAGGALWIIFGILTPALLSAWANFGARTPWGSGQLVSVKLSMGHLSEREQLKIERDPHKVAAHQIKPSLKLVGIGQSVVKRDDGTRVFELGLLPRDAERILKRDTQMSLRVQAPSVELLTQDLMRSERGERLKQSFDRSQDRVMNSWLELWPDLKSRLEAHFSAEDFKKIIKDEVIINRIKRAFMVEVSAQLNLDELKSKLSESPQLESLAELATRHVNFGSVFRESMIGATRSGSVEVKEIKAKTQELWRGGELPIDMIFCAARGMRALRGIGAVAIGAIFGRGESKLCNQLKASAVKVVKSSVKEGGKDFLGQSYKSLTRESESVSTELTKLGEEITEATRAPVLLKRFWLAINQDEELMNHIRVTYGQEGVTRFQLAMRELSASQAVSDRLSHLRGEVESLAQEGFKALVLDREGKGPNPLLLSVIQEQLSGEARPIIHIVPGSAERVNPSYLFESRALVEGDELTQEVDQSTPIQREQR